MQKFWQQKFWTQIQGKLKIKTNPSSKNLMTAVRFVFLILISTAPALLPLLWKIQKCPFFFFFLWWWNFSVTDTEIWKRNTSLSYFFQLLFSSNLHCILVSLFSDTLYFLVRWTVARHCLHEGWNNCFLHSLKAILSVRLCCAWKEDKLRGRGDFFPHFNTSRGWKCWLFKHRCENHLRNSVSTPSPHAFVLLGKPFTGKKYEWVR